MYEYRYMCNGMICCFLCSDKGLVSSYTQIYEHTDSPIILEPGSCIFDPVSAHTRIQDVRKGGLSLVRLPLLRGFPHIDSPAPAEAQLATTTDCLHYSKTGGRWGGPPPPPASSPEGDSSSTLRRMGDGFHVYIPIPSS